MIFTSLKRPRGTPSTHTPVKAKPVAVEGLEPRRLMTATLAFSASEYAAREGELRVVLTVVRAGDDLTGDVYANYTTVDANARRLVDYVPTSGQIFIPEGQLVTNIVVPILDNAATTGDKDFFVVLTDADFIPGATNENRGDVLVAPSTAHVTIVDDDARLQFSSPTYEVNENAGTAAVTVQRVGVTSDHVQVDVSTYAVTGGATAGVDFPAFALQTLDFLPGETAKTITLPITADAISNEGTEAIGLLLDNPRIVVDLGQPQPAVPTNVFVFGQPDAAQPVGSAFVNILDIDRAAPQILSITPNIGRRNRFESLTLQFSEPLRQATAESVSSYGVFNRAADGAFATGRRSDVRLLAASYNAANNTVTLIPRGAFALNRVYQLVVYAANGPTDLAGNPVDTDGAAGAPFTNYSTFFGVGTRLTYADTDGDLVRLKLTRGLMDLRRTLNGAASSVRILQSDPGRSILTGTVARRGPIGNGQAIIETLGPISGIDNRLTNPPFVLQNLI